MNSDKSIMTRDDEVCVTFGNAIELEFTNKISNPDILVWQLKIYPMMMLHLQGVSDKALPRIPIYLDGKKDRIVAREGYYVHIYETLLLLGLYQLPTPN